MTDQVVSSRFGTRPLLEVPAMQVSGQASQEVISIQAPPIQINTNPFPAARNPMLGAGTYNPPHPGYFTTGGLPPAPIRVPLGGYPPRIPMSAPQGPFVNAQGRHFYYGPNGETIFPAPAYNPQAMYPGMNYPPGPGPAGPYRIPYPEYGMTNPGFNITCELEYGRVMNIDVRDSQGEFRGIPEFLRTELQRTYGQYPYTEVRIKLEGGEFHIYATHENPRLKYRRRHRHRHRGRDSDSDSELYYDDDYYYDDGYRGVPEFKSDIESSGVGPRRRGERPRGILRERGWNRYR